MRVLKFRNPSSEYVNVVADKPNLGLEGPLTNIFSEYPEIFFEIHERSFKRVFMRPISRDPGNNKMSEKILTTGNEAFEIHVTTFLIRSSDS